MTIKEIEEVLYMSRSNIRFYEKEGLLEPQRDNNGYRDYTEKDLDTLRKIKLFRQLHLSVATIKQVQQGEQALSDAIQDKIEELNSDISDYMLAQKICQYIKNDDAKYGDIDAQKYLKELHTLTNKDTTYFSIQNDKIAIVPHPWRRYFARTLDLAFYGLIWIAFSYLVLRWNQGAGFIISLINAYISIGLMLVIEPLLLSTWGTTLGKWVFGLVIRNINGKKLTYRQAYQRTFGVFSIGMGYNIPIYNIIREIKCYGACDQEAMSWEEDFTYLIKDIKLFRAIAYVGLTIAISAIGILVILQAQMPIHRGNITAEQYYENCNDIMSYSKIDYGKSLNKQGKWVENDSDGIVIIELSSIPLPEHELIISEGIIKEVKIEIETDTNEWISDCINQKYIAVMSFLAAQKEMNGIRLYRSGIVDKINNGFRDYSFVEGGIRVTNKVEYRGYELFGDQHLFPIEGEKQYYHMVFTLEKIAP
ncbi:MAG: hypothetical protein CVV02_07705 [Firmicutes bacterium HGW-Firmicutes-7]|nr:MAG: hypothetical protein CVV02_07705 [Firmicutes bacterium HGW-Firmicutes-7]